MWGVHTKHWLVIGWLVIITSHVNRDSAYFHTPIPSMDSHLICLFTPNFCKFLAVSTPQAIELSFLTVWAEVDSGQTEQEFFWSGHSFLNRNWQRGWAEHLEMWMPRVVLRSLSPSSDPAALDQASPNRDRRESNQEYQGEQIFKEGWKYQ